jgi:hypothetical protein
MVPQYKIRDLVTVLHSISYDDTSRLDPFLAQVKDIIRDLFGPYSHYMTCFDLIRFYPPVGRSSSLEEDIRFWARAKRQLRDLFFVMLDDEVLNEAVREVRKRPQHRALSSHERRPGYSLALLSGISFFDLRSAFKNRVRIDFSKDQSTSRVPGPQNALKHMPLARVRIDLTGLMCTTDRKGDLLPGKGLSAPAFSHRRVFFLSGSDQSGSKAVLDYLHSLNLSVVCGDGDHFSSRSLRDQFMDCANPHVAVIVLNEACLAAFQDRGDDVVVRAPGPRSSFALGYLLGKLGRDRVVAVCPSERGFHRPTGFSEVIYVPYGISTPWRKELYGFLRDAGMFFGRQIGSFQRDTAVIPSV